jgi:uncharacterized membrane protein YfcA
MQLLALLLSVPIGLSLGLLGGGGSALAVPLLVYVGGVAPADAIGMSLAIVAVTSLVAALLHARTGGIDWRIAALFTPAGVVGALSGAQLTYLVSPDVLLALFGLLLLVIGGLMLLRASARLPQPTGDASRARGLLAVLGAGAVVGVLTGFLGVGGGFVIVPALVFLCRLDMKRAVGTSLVIIAVNSIAGLAGHLGRDDLDLGTTALFALFAAVGAFAGHALAARTHADRLQRGFAGLVVVVGGTVAARAIGLLPF